MHFFSFLWRGWQARSTCFTIWRRTPGRVPRNQYEYTSEDFLRDLLSIQECLTIFFLVVHKFSMASCVNSFLTSMHNDMIVCRDWFQLFCTELCQYRKLICGLFGESSICSWGGEGKTILFCSKEKCSVDIH